MAENKNKARNATNKIIVSFFSKYNYEFVSNDCPHSPWLTTSFSEVTWMSRPMVGPVPLPTKQNCRMEENARSIHPSIFKASKTTFRCFFLLPFWLHNFFVHFRSYTARAFFDLPVNSDMLNNKDIVWRFEALNYQDWLNLKNGIFAILSRRTGWP